MRRAVAPRHGQGAAAYRSIAMLAVCPLKRPGRPESHGVYELTAKPGPPSSAAGGALNAEYSVVSPSYLDVLGIPLRSGRAFRAEGDGEGRRVAIVNETFARELFPGEDPVGKKAFVWPGETGAGGRKLKSLQEEYLPLAPEADDRSVGGNLDS